VAPSVTTSEPVLATEGPLDRIFRWLARFFAKVTGQPDPITWASNPASKTLQKWQDIVGKVRGAANQAVAKASDVASKAVDTATNVANQAAQKVQQVIPPPTAPAKSTPVVEQPVQSTSEQTK
jgi:ABC-type transporter Mla subunit MlaD